MKNLESRISNGKSRIAISANFSRLMERYPKCPDPIFCLTLRPAPIHKAPSPVSSIWDLESRIIYSVY